MKEEFKGFDFRQNTLDTIDQANEIIDEYQAQGFKLTLRQLYYQFVSRAIIENSERSYKNLGYIINDGRLAGMIDWDAIEDRSRNLKGNQHWRNPAEIARSCVHSYYLSRWSNQPYKLEVWVEKEALAGVAEAACGPLDIDYFCCKGYTSQSEMYSAGKRLAHYARKQKIVIIHLGDHDPSGIDMSRDIHERIEMFAGRRIEFKRIALNMDQIEQYNPPPNPAKITDSRFAYYRKKYGSESWELDALEPKTLVNLIRDTVYEYRDPELLKVIDAKEREGKSLLSKMANELESYD
jgi:hypothetical protein